MGGIGGRRSPASVGWPGRAGKVSIPFAYDDSGSFSERFARVKVGEKWGFIDRRGRQAIDCRFDYAWDFEQGRARVRIGDEMRYISWDGNVLP